jgi:hypothetical protein
VTTRRPSAPGQAARALLAITVAALAVDALLAALSAVTDVAGRDVAPSWWVAGHLVTRGRWVVFSLIAAAVLSRSGIADDAAVDPSRVWRWMGVAALLAPLGWIAATWLVQAILFTAADRWDVDGLIFASPDYYRSVVREYVPWLLGGAVALAAARHVR